MVSAPPMWGAITYFLLGKEATFPGEHAGGKRVPRTGVRIANGLRTGTGGAIGPCLGRASSRTIVVVIISGSF